jgi:hypothetical protein
MSVEGADPGPSSYLYIYSKGGVYDGADEFVYVGLTSNPLVRFLDHRRDSWWKHVTHIAVERIDCYSHSCTSAIDGRATGRCSRTERDRLLLLGENRLISRLEPTQNRLLGWT